MSVEVLLIPLGIAAYGALSTLVREARSADLCERCQATRVTDVVLLREALSVLGATVTQDAGDRILASGPWGAMTFQRVGDLFLGRVDAGTDSDTRQMLEALDKEVGRIVQSRTAAIVMERAREMGFRLIEQYDDDGSLNYVFEEIR